MEQLGAHRGEQGESPQTRGTCNYSVTEGARGRASIASVVILFDMGGVRGGQQGRLGVSSVVVPRSYMGCFVH